MVLLRRDGRVGVSERGSEVLDGERKGGRGCEDWDRQGEDLKDDGRPHGVIWVDSGELGRLVKVQEWC